MKVMWEDAGKKQGNTFVLILDKKEAQTLVKIVQAAAAANRRNSTFRAWLKKIEERLPCW